MSSEAEFTSLRQEMLQSEANIVNMTTFVMTATGASLAAAFQYRNPIAALIPLFVLYLGNVIVFNNVQTIAIIGAYFYVFWEEEHKEFHWEARQAQRRMMIDEEGKKKRRKRSERREEWMGPLAQRMFFLTGYICIGVYTYVSVVAILNQQSTDFLIPPPYSWFIFLSKCFGFFYFLLLSFGIWSLKWFQSRRLTDPVHGGNSLMEQLRTAWNRVKASELATKRPVM